MRINHQKKSLGIQVKWINTSVYGFVFLKLSMKSNFLSKQIVFNYSPVDSVFQKHPRSKFTIHNFEQANLHSILKKRKL